MSEADKQCDEQQERSNDGTGQAYIAPLLAPIRGRGRGQVVAREGPGMWKRAMA